MKELSSRRFDALAGYTRSPYLVLFVEEVAGYESEDGRILGVVTHDLRDDDFGWVVLARDEAMRFRCIMANASLPTFDSACAALVKCMEEFAKKPDEAFHQGDVDGDPVDFFADVAPEDKRHRVFNVLARSPKYSCARGLVESMMRYHADADGHFVREFQSAGFDARLWELYIFATFSELRYAREEIEEAPDFVWTSPFGRFSVEATTLNPPPNKFVQMPVNPDELLHYVQNYIPIKFARALRKKLQRTPSYWDLPHTKGIPFVIATQDFHAPYSMTQINFVLTEYLFGIRHTNQSGDLVIERLTEHKYGEACEPSGFFNLPGAENVSAVIANPQGTLPKFNRMGYLAGFGDQSLQMTRNGLRRSDGDKGAGGPIPFVQTISDPSYEETWVEGMTVWHNPNAKIPLPPALIPGAAHEFLQNDGRIMSLLPKFHPIFSRTKIEHASHSLDVPSS